MTSQPTLSLESDPCQPGSAGCSVCNLDADLVGALGSDPRAADDLLRCIFRVTVAQTGAPAGADLPDVFGRYRVSGDRVRFIPHFPFEPGVHYRARFDPRPLGRPELSDVLTLEFSLPEERSVLPPAVSHIFPSSDRLPENLLRFYVHFSGSMQRGRVAGQIAILGADGQPVPDVLYRPPVELWDRSMRCLTILLDPGRLKRGVGPNRALGPPLKVGDEYTLAVGSGMIDRFGGRLREPFYKRFRATNAVREHVAVEQWKMTVPATGSARPLVLMFPRPLDSALLSRAITVAPAGDRPVDGRPQIDRCETRWSFTPTSPWAAGSYTVRVGSSLEDVCGNSVMAAFDRPLRSGGDLAYEVTNRSISFHLA